MLATARGKALTRDPRERTVRGFAGRHFVSTCQYFLIVCSLWFCKGWCRSNKASNTVSQANISRLHSDLTSIIHEVHISCLTFALLFLRRLDEPRGRNGSGLRTGPLPPAAYTSAKQHPSLRLQLPLQMFKGLIYKNSQENNYTFISSKHFARK